jgi:aspartate carbamoyltransferase regulatory subunit
LIEEGTVIDHIPAGRGLQISALLGLDRHTSRVTIGLNLVSRRLGKKDLIKVEQLELTPDEANQIALLAPRATINIVQEHRVARKFQVTTPEVIERIIVCPNRRCITNCEPVATRFQVKRWQGETWLRCHYCEKRSMQSEIEAYRT